MESGIVLFMGMVRRGEFESLQNRNVPLGVLVDTNSSARLADVSNFALVDRFDFSRPTSELIARVREIRQRLGLACLFNVVEFYVAQTAEVAQALGLASISPASAQLCLEKNRMRERFRDRIGPDAGARFNAITGEADLVASAKRLGYPVFLQPTNVSASMWATRNADEKSLLQNYRAMVDEVPRYYQRLGQKSKTLAVSLAEYLEGANTSIDCLMDADGRVYTTPAVDVLTGRDIGIDDFHHFARIVPSGLSGDEQARLRGLAVAGVRALDLASAAAHVEFIGPKLGEIAARPGGNRPRILEMAYGIDMLYAYYQILQGHVPDLKPTRAMPAAIVTPFAPRNGVLRRIRHLDLIPQLPGYHYHEVRAISGAAVGLAKSGYRAPLYIELLSENSDDVRRGVDRIASWTDLYELE